MFYYNYTLDNYVINNYTSENQLLIKYTLGDI